MPENEVDLTVEIEKAKKQAVDGFAATIAKNIGTCGACAEGIFCGSTMHKHEGCPVAERDALVADLATLTSCVAEWGFTGKTLHHAFAQAKLTLDQLRAERDQLRAQLAAARGVLGQVSEFEIHGQPTGLAIEAAAAMSPDAGAGWLPPKEVAQLRKEVVRLTAYKDGMHQLAKEAATLEGERNQLRNQLEKLESRLQIDPGGSDKIDELKSANNLLKTQVAALMKGLEDVRDNEYAGRGIVDRATKALSPDVGSVLLKELEELRAWKQQVTEAAAQCPIKATLEQLPIELRHLRQSTCEPLERSREPVGKNPTDRQNDPAV